jgi:hypothetical protein
MTVFERPRYFTGNLITAEDFEQEQRYHIEKRCLLNRMLQGAGIVSGLEVVAGRQGTVNVAPGLALDPHSREILVSEPQQPAIPDCGEPVSNLPALHRGGDRPRNDPRNPRSRPGRRGCRFGTDLANAARTC